MQEQTPEPTQKKPEKSLGLRLKEKLSPLKQLFAKQPVRLGSIIAGLLLVVASLGWWGWSNSSLSKLSVDAALTEGKVQYRLAYDDPWENAQEGMSFGEGAHIRTLDESRAALHIDDGSAVRLNANSSVVLTKLTAKHIVIENTGGDVYTRVVKSTKRVFQVRSASTIYQSLGTAYRTFNANDKKGVEVYQGKVAILGSQSDGSIVVSQGERYFAVNTAATDLEGKITELSIADLAGDEFLQWNSQQDRKDFAKELGVLSDLSPPPLEITTPASGFSTEAASIEVAGKTEKDAKIVVNGNEVANNQGSFTTVVNLSEGSNSIKIEAIDKVGNKTVKDITVTRTTPLNFKLSGTKADKGISLTWEVSGISVNKGFKLIKSTSANPTYSSKSDYVTIESPTRSYTWNIQDGKTYHFRICVYTGESCTPYSNDVTVTAPQQSSSVTLSSKGGSNVSWAFNGSPAPYGYRLVWSTTKNPTYPTNNFKIYEQPDTSGSITSDPGYYYVRICTYNEAGGECKLYSNEIYVHVP